MVDEENCSSLMETTSCRSVESREQAHKPRAKTETFKREEQRNIVDKGFDLTK
jgi:hypothetical protein